MNGGEAFNTDTQLLEGMTNELLDHPSPISSLVYKLQAASVPQGVGTSTGIQVDKVECVLFQFYKSHAGVWVNITIKH
jgi:hypothetical protein